MTPKQRGRVVLESRIKHRRKLVRCPIDRLKTCSWCQGLHKRWLPCMPLPASFLVKVACQVVAV